MPETNGVRVSELTNGRELRALRDGDALNGGTLLVWDLSAAVPRPWGVSPSWQTSQKPLVRGFEYTCPTLKVTTELQELITCVSCLYIRWKLEGWESNCAISRHWCAILRWHTGAALSQDCAPVPRDLKIAHWCRAISRSARNFGILRMRSAISRLCKFLDCVEHVH